VADAWGIEENYVDALGERQTVSSAVIRQLRDVIGRPDAATTPIVIGAADRLELTRGELVLEDGETIKINGPVANLPIGYHTFEDERNEPRRIIVSPRRCHVPRDRSWGWAAQLYAARSRSSWGIGDLGDLHRLASFARDVGAGFVLVNPMGAVAPCVPQQPSPYFPATRRFHNPIYLDVEQIADRRGGIVDDEGAAGRALNESGVIDRDAVWQIKRRALDALWRTRSDSPRFDEWYARQPHSLQQFAAWSSLVERHGGDFRRWPRDFHRPDSTETSSFAATHTDAVKFHAWLQWLFTQQLERVDETIAVMHDLPIGFDPAGFDAWTWQDSLAANVTIGAPPDEFNRQGQNWGLPAFVPSRLREQSYEPFIDTIATAIGSSGGGLRIDHVMGLSRLWWIPEGNDPAEGAYVRYPCDDLLAILAIESHRAQAVIVGEDLGTVEEDFRALLAQHDILSYRLLWFEEDHPSRWPEKCLAAITTHDLPTVAGLWSDEDLDEQRRSGLHPDEAATKLIRDRLEQRGELAANSANANAVVAAHRLLAQAPARLIVATIDDALTVTTRPNIPGADGARPNWSLALPQPLDDIERDPLVHEVSAALSQITRHGG
jgi:4-alpha-glucanotransferase